jgi:hypothetical protein
MRPPVLTGTVPEPPRGALIFRKRAIRMLLVAIVALLAAIVTGSAAILPSAPAAVSSAAPSRSSTTGTLTFAAELPGAYPVMACPAGTPITVECFQRKDSGTIRGLGNVEESHPYFVEDSPAACDPNQVRVLPTTAQISVAGRGELELRIAGTACLDRVPPSPLHADETFTITGGSGRYAGASGGGTLASVSYGPPAFRAKDTWTGTLVVPGLDFDLTPPTLTGPNSKSVRAPRRVKRVRVVYAFTAQDDVDGAVPVICRPRSGSWFRLGRTRVRCSATDTSGNESTTILVVIVTRTR